MRGAPARSGMEWHVLQLDPPGRYGHRTRTAHVGKMASRLTDHPPVFNQVVLSSSRQALDLKQSLSMLTVIGGADFCFNSALFRGPPTIPIRWHIHSGQVSEARKGHSASD
ncbi:hypothetical protein BC2230_30434 [Burkholderia cepacia]